MLVALVVVLNIILIVSLCIALTNPVGLCVFVITFLVSVAIFSARRAVR